MVDITPSGFFVVFRLYFIVYQVCLAGKSITNSDFTYLVREPTFVDKTLFIKEILEDRGNKIVLTAPRGFGKSSNLQMLKAFFQIEVDKNGNKVTSMKDGSKPIKDTPNYKLFQQKKIINHRDAMDNHFGKYPVIQLDFKNVVGFTSFNESQDFIKEVLHEAISEHSYLKNSEKLFDDEKEFIRLWSSDEYKLEDMGTLIPGLEKLSKYLFKHFDRTRVIVLIDHYDSPIFYCVTHTGVAQDAFNYVINVVQAFFHIPKDDYYVDTFILTGVSQVEEPHVSNARVIERYEFLNQHRFVPFFGFVDSEVFDLVGRYAIEVDDELLESVHKHYGGYESLDNVTVHNPWALLNYLDRQKFEHIWARRSRIPNLQMLLKIPDVHQKLERMLKGLPTVMELKKVFSFENFKVLRDLVNEPNGKRHLMYSTLLFSLLFERGFLSYDPSVVSAVSDARRYVIPNEEVKKLLWETLDE
ncbi:uncharacterized protein LOC129000563 [Macrosteles quadrilineatus]|uniref:uncharacterized protein LOC129000563 n=1 Tax=Macrosteles quadrilineatus TaxID=74068 RepID=UPI0023E1D89C|nr:uncharacterized protein LOC129000563 [Macrosteles quadrilineatus]